MSPRGSPGPKKKGKNFPLDYFWDLDNQKYVDYT